MTYQQAVPDGIILTPDAPVMNYTFSTSTNSDLVVVEEDILQEFYQGGSKRPSYRLVYAKGAVASKAYLKSLGVKKYGDEPDTAVHEHSEDSPEQSAAVLSTQDQDDKKPAETSVPLIADEPTVPVPAKSIGNIGNNKRNRR